MTLGSSADAYRARPAVLARRQLLLGAAAGTGLAALGACGPSRGAAPRAVGLKAIEAVEARRPHTGVIRRFRLAAQASRVDLGGRVVDTWTYGDTVPGPLLRANVGDTLAVTVHNGLSQPTSVHWHGVAVRNDMDGVPPVTQHDIAAGRSFTYRFRVPDPGTYWVHPHVGLQLDHGLYAPLIVDDPREPGGYDEEWIVVLDDWTDGLGDTPERIYARLRKEATRMDGMGMGGMGMGGSAGLLGGDGGDVRYPGYLVNGRLPAAPASLSAKPGQRVRIRLINAAADTAFRVALAGHALRVTHTDGLPVVPREVDALLLGMGERYDALVTVQSGVFPLVAVPEGKSGIARAVLRTGAGAVPAVDLRPAALDGRVGTVGALTAAAAVALPERTPDRTLDVLLAGGMGGYEWTINGRPYDRTRPLTVRQGQRARLRFVNHSMMYHPMHLHGHTVQVRGGTGVGGPRKDTLVVLPMQGVQVDLNADNPGAWMLHCHNAYHAEAGMMTRLEYRT